MDAKTIHDLASTGRHQDCLQTCQQLLQSEPDNPLPWKYAGKSLLALGQFEKAQQCLTKAYQLDTKDPETTKDIGNIFLSLGRTEDASEWYQKSLKINNNYAPAINNIANIKRQSGNNQEAVNLFKQAIQADPQLVQAYAGAAASSLTLGNLDQAQTFARQAIEINSKAPGLNEILGIIFQNKKNYQQAVDSYQRELAINPKSNSSLLNLGLLLLQQGKAAAAIEPLSRAAEINSSEQCLLLLAQAYQNIGKLKEAIIEYKKIDIIQSQNKMISFNLGLCLLNTGGNIDAIEAFKIAIKLDESFLPAWGNIGTALKNEGRYHEALLATQKVLELDPENPTALINLGGIYKDLGNLDEALASTLKSLDLKPDNPTAHMNLGGIYKDLGNLDQALACTLKALELQPNDLHLLHNLGVYFVDPLIANVDNFIMIKAYEELLNFRNFDHQDLSLAFAKLFLPLIKSANSLTPVVSNSNKALSKLSSDWRFTKSLSLLIPPYIAVESFLAKLRREFLLYGFQNSLIPRELISLLHALAMQCSLNEHVYYISEEEELMVDKLMTRCTCCKASFNEYLAVIACYFDIHELDFEEEWIQNYSSLGESQKSLIALHWDSRKVEKHFRQEIDSSKIEDPVSKKVKEMYEENPYPRYMHAAYKSNELSETPSQIINRECTKVDNFFSKELDSELRAPHILIAGCGTGRQVLMASRYKNAQITAIDISGASLAYSMRKALEYNMKNVNFELLDILNVQKLSAKFDLIESYGVIHHMDNPKAGLAALLKRLKPGGYIKLALYSQIARSLITKARRIIRENNIEGKAKGIRSFRQKVVEGEYCDLNELTSFASDFYSLSMCRDLCFHVQEHQFTSASLEALLLSQGLTFCGFMIDQNIKSEYAKHFPSDSGMTSLKNWDVFEHCYPDTFRNCYVFWAQKDF